MIVCAALKINKKTDKGIEEIVMPCLRHGFGWSTLNSLVGDTFTAKDVVEGFIDNKGNFLDRIEALEHAEICGQLSQSTRWYKEDHGDTELYSEDLY